MTTGDVRTADPQIVLDPGTDSHLWYRSHHMEKTEAGLQDLCIREITLRYTI